MLSIVYSSTATRPFEGADLEDLLASSRETNERLGLTGLLVHRDGRFLQLIEGADDDVRSRMAAIRADDRHGEVRVLLEDDIEQRRFPDWTMGYQPTEGGAERIPGFRRSFDDIDADRTDRGSLPALRALIAWFRARHDG